MNTHTEFRILNRQELEALEQDFVLFLSSMGIEGIQWEKYKTSHPQKVDALIAEFSNMVWQKVLHGKEYMEMFDTDFHFVFHFRENETEMIRLSRVGPMQVGRKIIQRNNPPQKAMFEALEAGARFCDQAHFEEAKRLFFANGNP